MTTRLHATTVAFRDGARRVGVLLEGPSASGKSDLALRLIDGGARLVADDITEIQNVERRLVAGPIQDFNGVLEIRGIGIVRVPCESSAEIVAIVSLMPDGQNPERHPDPESREVLNVALPLWRVAAEAPSAAARVRIIVGLATGAIQRFVG